MRIIVRGNLPGDQIYKATCSHCKTQFECLKHEGDFFAGDQRDGPFLRVICPVCTQKAIAYPTGKYEDRSKDNSRWGGSSLNTDRTSSLAEQYANPASQFDR